MKKILGSDGISTLYFTSNDSYYSASFSIETLGDNEYGDDYYGKDEEIEINLTKLDSKPSIPYIFYKEISSEEYIIDEILSCPRFTSDINIEVEGFIIRATNESYEGKSAYIDINEINMINIENFNVVFDEADCLKDIFYLESDWFKSFEDLSASLTDSDFKLLVNENCDYKDEIKKIVSLVDSFKSLRVN